MYSGKKSGLSCENSSQRPDILETASLDFSCVIDEYNSIGEYFKMPSSIQENRPTEVLDYKDKNGNSDTFEKNDKILCYVLPHRDAILLCITEAVNFTFTGCAEIKVLKGEMEILGYTITKNDDLLNVYSPTSAASLVLETKNKCSEFDPNSLDILILTYGLTKSTVDYLKSLYSQILSIFILAKCDSKIVNVMDHKHFNTRNKNEKYFGTKCKHLGFNIYDNNNFFARTVFKKCEKWCNISLENNKIVLAGGKGVGKSTLLRYLVNKSLPQYGRVMVLDFDPGQCEFSPPGCLSAVLVDKPLLGPNYTHIIEPERMVFLGEIDVSQCPQHYLQCVNYIIKFYVENTNFHGVPCIINTMGFCKGLGVKLMLSLLKLSSPDIVVQITSKDPKNNYPFYLTSDCLMKKSLFDIGTCSKTYKFITVESCVEERNTGSRIARSVNPREIREMLQLSYFLPLITNSLCLNEAVPYKISFSNLIITSSRHVSYNDVLKVCNASIVGLCKFDPSSNDVDIYEFSYPNYFKLIDKNQVLPCYGFGIVRGIDCEKQELYIVTPIPQTQLQNVNCLSLGSIGLSEKILSYQNTCRPNPYCTTLTNNSFIKRKFRKF